MTHGRSHLSLLRESYKKNDLKRKITAVNRKVSFIVGFCPFCFLSNLVGWQLFFFMLCYLLFPCLPPISSLCLFPFLSSTLLYFPLTYFFLPLISLYVPLTSKYQKSYHTFVSSLLGPSMDLGLSASLYISFLRISATYCVSWTK